jgi:hypothetical protein
MPRSLSPRLLSFDVFGTLISVRDGSYGAFRSILADAPGGNRVDVKEFFEYWEERNIGGRALRRCQSDRAGRSPLHNSTGLMKKGKRWWDRQPRRSWCSARGC